MPFSFPASPSAGLQSQQNGRTYSWSGSAWELVAASGGGTELFTYANTASFPGTGAATALYLSIASGRVYQWNGSVYSEVGPVGGDGTDTTLRSLFIPAAPTSVTAIGGNAQATVSWTAPTVLAQTPITDYTVQFSTNSGSTWTTFTRAASTATSGVVVTGLTNGTAYTFRVAAVNALGTGAYSTASSSVTPAAAIAIQYANKFGAGSYSVTGTGTATVTATVTGGGNSGDTRLWLLVGVSGTLSYTVTASSEDGYDGGRLYQTSSSPASHSSAAFNDDPPGLTIVSMGVTGSATRSGTASVTAGHYLVLRYAKDGADNAGSDSITATLSIA